MGVCNALIDNLLVADSPDEASLEMRAESTSYCGFGQAAQRNDALMRAQVLTATVAMRWRRAARSVPALEEYRSPCSFSCIPVISLEDSVFLFYPRVDAPERILHFPFVWTATVDEIFAKINILCEIIPKT